MKRWVKLPSGWCVNLDDIVAFGPLRTEDNGTDSLLVSFSGIRGEASYRGPDAVALHVALEARHIHPEPAPSVEDLRAIARRVLDADACERTGSGA